MRRIGTTPAERGSTGQNNCPDVIELDDMSYLVIGTTVTEPASIAGLADLGASVAPYETAVIVPRDCIHAAARQLATEGLSAA